VPPNNSFKPKLLRSGNGVAEKACHAVACATQFGLTQVLGLLMEFIRSLLVILGLPATVMVYLMYFASLYEFAKTLEQEHPSLWKSECDRALIQPSRFNIAYRVLSKQRNGSYQGQDLGPRTLAALPGLKRLLYTGASMFLVFVLVMLTDPANY